jgi:putative salt-induced outer membrane protein
MALNTNWTTGAAALAVALAFARPAAADLPPAVAAMIARAAESGDPDLLEAVTAVARDLHPDSQAEIAGLAQLRETAVAAPPLVATPAAVEPEASWKGSVELGGGLSQGKNETLGGYGAIELVRTGPVWSHRLTSRGDYQESNGRTTTERLNLAYEPRVQLSPGRYVFGLAQYEHDRSLGYANRYTVGAGLGLKAADSPTLKIALDFGPALRFTEHYELDDEAAVAGRGSVNVRWLPTERVTLSQEGDVYFESEKASARSITALETLLFGPLKARLSYNLHYERNALGGRSGLDTTTRASLLYKF